MNKKINLAIFLAFAVGLLCISLGSVGLWQGLRLSETTPEEVTGQGNKTGTGTTIATQVFSSFYTLFSFSGEASPTTETTQGTYFSVVQTDI